MNLFLKITLCTISFLSYCISSAQIEEENTLEESLEYVAEENDSALDLDALLQRLNNYKKNKLNLNTASKIDLSELKILNQNQITSFLRHRLKAKKLISIYELQGIPFFDLVSIKRLLPYVSIKDNLYKVNSSIKNILKDGTHTLLLRDQYLLETQKGYLDKVVAQNGDTVNYFLGNKHKLYARYNFKFYQNLSLGITAEKDEGEQFFNSYNPHGFDFYSAHFYTKDIGPFKYFALGDYALKFGQGLTMWSGLPMRKGSNVLGSKKNGYTIVPFSSVNEFYFRRGIAATFKIKSFEVSPFASYKFIDGNSVEADSTDQEVSVFSSFVDNGFHNTVNLYNDKKVINEQMYGANIDFKKENVEFGVRAFYTRFDKALKRNLNPYNYFLFNGDSLLNASIDYNINYQNFNFYGETAISSFKGFATVNGILMSLDPSFSINILYRKFNESYFAIYGNAFTEQSTANNEEGYYFAAEFNPNYKWKFSTYYDNYKHKWLRYFADAPSKGVDYLWRIEYKPKRGSSIYFRFKHENKLINQSDNSSAIDKLEFQKTSSIRLHSSIKLSKNLILKNRVEYKLFATENHPFERGFLIYQDIVYQPKEKRYELKARLTYFDTEGYNSRIYAYENDMYLLFTVPAYFDSGMKYILNFRYKLNRNISFWMRFDQIHYLQKKSVLRSYTIGSGKTLIEGNTLSKIKMQMRLKF